MSRSSATGRRRERIFPETLGLRQALHPRDDTAGSAGSEARTTRSAAAHRTSIASPARMRDPNRQGSDRIRGDGRPSQNALPLKILRRPQPPEAGAQNDGLNALIGGRVLGDLRCYSRSWVYLRVYRLVAVQVITTHLEQCRGLPPRKACIGQVSFPSQKEGLPGPGVPASMPTGPGSGHREQNAVGGSRAG